jgi:hypothetical protein
MTKPGDEAPPAGAPELETYIRENRAAFTEAALRRQALAAGHPPEAIEAALTATRDASRPVDRGRVVRNLFLAYLAVYLVLDVLMLVNPANVTSGLLGDARAIGIIFLSVALGGAFVASLVWVASRRLFIGLVGGGIAISSLSSLATNLRGDLPLAANVVGVAITLLIAGAGVALAVAAARVGRTPAPAAPSSELLIVVPILLLLAVGGTCVASGLPIPRPA